jgi:hypothetical protein
VAWVGVAWVGAGVACAGLAGAADMQCRSESGSARCHSLVMAIIARLMPDETASLRMPGALENNSIFLLVTAIGMLKHHTGPSQCATS